MVYRPLKSRDLSMPTTPYYDPEVRVAIEAAGSLGTINANTLADARVARRSLYESRPG